MPTAGHQPDPFLPLPPLTAGAARTEAERCLYCYDAACTRACPTGIDVAGVHPQDRDGQPRGQRADDPRGQPARAPRAAPRARSSACARAPASGRPWTGRSRSGACSVMPWRRTPPSGGAFFTPGEEAGVSAAIIGAGPAGLACAAELRKAGHRGHALRRERARRRPGRPRHRALAPAARDGRARGRRGGAGRGPSSSWARRSGGTSTPQALLAGQRRGRRRRRPGPRQAAGRPRRGPRRASWTRSTSSGTRSTGAGPATRSLGRRVGVIGGGSTAFDAAAAAVRLGAEEVTLFYRRSAVECPAYPHAIDLARSLGVAIRWLTAPVEIHGSGGPCGASPSTR